MKAAMDDELIQVKAEIAATKADLTKAKREDFPTKEKRGSVCENLRE
jgi:hypothetical protein